MTELLQQVEEIRRKAHVCPECQGKGKVSSHPYGWLVDCKECQGTGEIPAPDTDALCSALVTLAQAVEAEEQKTQAASACRRGDDGGVKWYEGAYADALAKKAAALALLRDGMPPNAPGALTAND
jgi:RecJ-like exonuclease